MHKTDRIMIITGVVVLIVALALSAVLGSSGGPPFVPPLPPPEPHKANMTSTQNGYADENSETTFSEDLISPIQIDLTLTWTDEADATARHTNSPDQFGLRLDGPNGESSESSVSSNTGGGPGEVTLSFNVPREKGNWTQGTGEWNITVICGDCGDHKPIFSLLTFRDRPDDGNNWDISIVVLYYDTEGDAGGEEA